MPAAIKVDSLVKRRKVSLTELRLKQKSYSDIGRVSSISKNDKKVLVIWNDVLPAIEEYKAELKMISDPLTNNLNRCKIYRLRNKNATQKCLAIDSHNIPVGLGKARNTLYVHQDNVDVPAFDIPVDNPVVGFAGNIKAAINQDATAFEV